MNDDQISIDLRTFNSAVDFMAGNHTYFLKDDLRLGVKILSDEIKKSLRINIQPESVDIVKKLIDSTPYLSGYYNKNLKNHFIELLDFLTLGLMEDGYFVFERVKFNEDGDINLYIMPVTGNKVTWDKKQVYQWIPIESQRKLNLPSKIKIERSKCYIIEFPKNLGGNKYYQKVLSEINLSDQFIQKSLFAMKQMAGNFHSYDYTEHRYLSELYAWKVSKKFGWHHRTYNSYEQPGTEHYKFSRRLKCKRTSLILREHLVEFIILIYEDLSKHLGNEIKVKIEGLPELAEIDSAIDKWYKGELEYEDISDYTII